MRVGIAIDDLDRRRGGMSEWCWQFVRALARRGDELHVVAQGFGEEPLPDAVVQHFVPRTRSRLALAATCEQTLRAIEPDIAHDMGIGWHFNVFQPHGGSYAAWTSRRLDIYPLWLRAIKRPVDALLPRHRDFASHWQRQCAAAERSGATVIALSNVVAESMIDANCFPSSRVVVIHNGVDCQRFSPAHREEYRAAVRRRLGIADDTLVVLLAAHNFRLKGVPELLHVSARLIRNQRRLHVLIAGGNRLEGWRLAAARWGIARHVTFLGSVTDMVPVFAAADAYVHPTYYDPCSLVLLEAAASGLPIITTRRFNGAVELFHEDEEALVVDSPADRQRLYECVEAVFADRLRAKLSSAARRVALRNPIERNVAEIVRLYERQERRRLAA